MNFFSSLKFFFARFCKCRWKQKVGVYTFSASVTNLPPSMFVTSWTVLLLLCLRICHAWREEEKGGGGGGRKKMEEEEEGRGEKGWKKERKIETMRKEERR